MWASSLTARSIFEGVSKGGYWIVKQRPVCGSGVGSGLVLVCPWIGPGQGSIWVVPGGLDALRWSYSRVFFFEAIIQDRHVCLAASRCYLILLCCKFGFISTINRGTPTLFDTIRDSTCIWLKMSFLYFTCKCCRNPHELR